MGKKIGKIWDKMKGVLGTGYALKILLIIGVVGMLGPSFEVVQLLEEKSLQNLETSVREMKNEIVAEVEYNMSLLKLEGKEWMKEDNLYEWELLPSKLAAVQEISIFKRIDVLYPDNQLLLQNGEVKDVSDTMSFTEIAEKGEHISEYVLDIKNEDVSVFRCYVPVLKNNEIIAVLVGIIDETSFTKLCGRQRNVCILYCEDGTFVLDNWPEELGSIEETAEREVKSKYENVNFLRDIRNGRIGTTAYSTGEKGDYTYFCYTPLHIFGCELLIFTEEDVLFGDSNKIEKILLCGCILAGLILLLYWAIIDHYDDKLHQSEWVAEMTEKFSDVILECSNIVCQSMNEENMVNDLLLIMLRQLKGNKAYVFEIDYDTNSVANTYLYSMEDSSEQLGNISLNTFQSWLNRFSESDEIFVPMVLNDFSEGSKLNSILVKEGLKHIIVIPLRKNSTIVGFVCISDVCYVESYDELFIQPVADFIITGLSIKERGEVQEELFEDALTKMYNENKFQNVVNKYKERVPETLGVAYFSLKELQTVDGKLDSKDEALVKNAAGNITYVFEKQSFRIAENRFAVIVSNVNRMQFEKEVRNVCRLMEMSSIEISVGMSWHEKDANIVMQMYEAENEVLQSKKVNRQIL
ncbi:MAG: cache domain-containing protein [Lachnospiraceae bacterium]|nr:cache domain-containing protein [Lachnospiraceae bacterium]